jgi:hypothetical protein
MYTPSARAKLGTVIISLLVIASRKKRLDAIDVYSNVLFRVINIYNRREETATSISDVGKPTQYI